MKNLEGMGQTDEMAVAQPVETRQRSLDFWPKDRRRELRVPVDVSSASAVLLRLFDELAYGLIVIDAGRRVVHINRAARGAVAREQRLRVRGRALEAWRERDAKPFTLALDTAFCGKRAVLKIGESPGTIMLVPLPGTVSTSAVRASPVGHIALVFERSACAESLSIALYAQNHGLTSGEERVLRALNEDQSVGEVASTLGTAISTIRTHVNHIREKTGARSLRALVANVRSVPPLMPAFGELLTRSEKKRRVFCTRRFFNQSTSPHPPTARHKPPAPSCHCGWCTECRSPRMWV